MSLLGDRSFDRRLSLLSSQDAKLQLAQYHIGTLVASETPTEVATTPMAPDPIFLSKTKWKRAKLVEIDHINHDSRNYRFALEYPEQELGLPTGQHVYARLRRKVCPGDAEDNGGAKEAEGEMVQRAYTPVSSQYAKGFLDMLIKVRLLPLSRSPCSALELTSHRTLSRSTSARLNSPRAAR